MNANSLYQKKLVQANPSPMYNQQKLNLHKIPVKTPDKGAQQNMGFQLETKNIISSKTERLQTSNAPNNNTMFSNQYKNKNLERLETLLKQSEKFTIKAQLNTISLNMSNGKVLQQGQSKITSGKNLNLSATDFSSQQKKTQSSSSNIKFAQNHSQKIINLQSDTKRTSVNAQQAINKNYVGFQTNYNPDKEPILSQRGQRSLSSTILTSNQKNMSNLSPQNNNLISYSNYNKNFDITSQCRVLIKNQSQLKISQKKITQAVDKSYNTQPQNLRESKDQEYFQFKQIKPQLQTLSLIKTLKQKVQNLQRQNSDKEKAILKLKNDVLNKNKMCEDLNKLLKLKYSEVNKLKDQFIIVQKQKDNALAKLEFLDENMKIDIYQKKIYKISEELQQAKTKIFEFSNRNSIQTQTIKELQEKISELIVKNKKQEALKQINTPFINSETIKSPDKKASKGKSQLLTALDDALKVQLKQIEQLKAVIQTSDDQKLKLRENLLQARRQIDVMRNEMTIIEIKANSERKNIITEYRLQIHQKENEINNLNKKLRTLQQKYKGSLVHIKSKDDFLQQHLVGRTNQIDVKAYIQKVLKDYSQNFDSILDVQNQNKDLSEKLKKYEKYQNL